METVENTPLTGLIFGFASEGKVDDQTVERLISLFSLLLQNKCVLVIAENDPILQHPSFLHFINTSEIIPSLLNGDQIPSTDHSVVHIMKWRGPACYNEIITSLAATGASMIVHYSEASIGYSSHPFVPVFRLTKKSQGNGIEDSVMEDEEDHLIMQKIVRVLSREKKTVVR